MSEMRSIQEKALYRQADAGAAAWRQAFCVICVILNDKQWIAALHKPRYAKATVAARPNKLRINRQRRKLYLVITANLIIHQRQRRAKLDIQLRRLATYDGAKLRAAFGRCRRIS